MLNRVKNSLFASANLRWLMFVFAGAIVISSFTALIVLSLYVRRDIDALATAKADNTEWVLSQSEVELHKLKYQILLQMNASEHDLQSIRRHFDVFYSRAVVLLTADTYANLRVLPEGLASSSSLGDYLEQGVAIVDSPDANLKSSLPQFLEMTDKNIAEVHNLSLLGVQIFSESSFDQRKSVSWGLARLAVITTALIVLLLIGLFVMAYMTRLTRKEVKRRTDAYHQVDAIVSTALDAIIVTTPTGKVIDFNSQAEEIFGFSANEVNGNNLIDFIIPEHSREAHNAGIKRYADGHSPRIVGQGRIRISGLHKDGHEIPLELSISSAPYRDTEILVSYLRDITSELENEQELIQARDQAIAGEKAKANLLAVMSHEIRTPLNGLIGSADLMAQTKLDSDQQKYVRVMKRTGADLMSHVNDVLDISRLDSGHFKFLDDCYSPRSLIQETVENHIGHAHGKKLKLKVLESMPLERSFIGDRRRIQQVLNNLVNNSIKFTENGTVTIDVKFDSKTQVLTYIIEDTGVGIPDDDLERVFDDFVTLDSSYVRQEEGTGLGLGISKRLIYAMGGEINIESKIGVGTKVSVIVSTQEAHETDVGNSPDEIDIVGKINNRSLNILVVEDNATNRFIIGQYIKNSGHKMDEAHDGRQGVKMAGEQPYDLIFMDISMPGVDGVSATKMIRNESKLNKNTPIIALTAHALPEELKKFEQAGMSLTVTKPINMEKLQSALELAP